MKKSSLLFIAAIGLLSSCVFNSRGSGEIVTETQELDGVTELAISGIIDIRLNQGDNPKMTIEGEEGALEELDYWIDGNKLEIGYEGESGWFFKSPTPKITITLSDLEELRFDGVGNFVMQDDFQIEDITIRGSGIGNINLGMNAESIKARFDMMGNISFSGSAEEMELRNDGVGQIDAGDLVVQRMDLNSSGIGKIDIMVEDELSIEVNGIGSVTYSGNPTILKEDVNGIGKVTQN